jgi:hypothetical protein
MNAVRKLETKCWAHVLAIGMFVALTGCGGEVVQEDAPPDHPVTAMQLDPGMKYTLSANGTVFGEIVVLQGTVRTTDYYTLLGAMPAPATSITLQASAYSGGAPAAYTFAIPSKTFTAATVPAPGTSLYVNSASQFGLSWNFIYNTVLGKWTGSATWYHSSSGLITLRPGSYTLTNNTAASSLTFRAVNQAP